MNVSVSVFALAVTLVAVVLWGQEPSPGGRLRSVVQNVVRRSDADIPHVEIPTAYRPDAVYQAEIPVVDDQSTTPEMEQDLIQMGGETSMDHTSGIGLLTARWIVDAVEIQYRCGHRTDEKIRATGRFSRGFSVTEPHSRLAR